MNKELTPLKVLDYIKKHTHLYVCSSCRNYKNCKILKCIWKEGINIIENSLKALEIIKKGLAKEEYIFPEYSEELEISKEEYDLLKEVLL